MENLRRYLNVIRKMDLQDEKKISEALKLKGLYENSNSFPLSSLHFELTESCNAYCKHCYNVSGNNIKADRMTPASWVDFSKYIVEKGGVFECLLSGGEPLLLGNYLFDIMDGIATHHILLFFTYSVTTTEILDLPSFNSNI